MLLRKLSILAFIPLVLTSTSSIALGQYSFTTYAEPSNSLSVGTEAWIAAVREGTAGAVDFEIHYGGALMPARDGLRGIGQGVAHAGAHVSTYTPSENALWAALADVAFKVPDPLVAAFASTEYAFFDEQGRGEWLDNGVVSLSGFATTGYAFLCRDSNVKTLSDLQGKRVRTPGGPWARFASGIGLVDVNLPSSEIYTAMERGAIDCALADTSHIIAGASLLDLLRSVVATDIGLFFPGSTILINAQTWDGISVENRKVMLDAAAVALVERQVNGYTKLAEDGIEAARAAGVAIYQPDQAMADAYDAFLSTIDQEIIRVANEAGVPDIETEIADISALMTKWQDLLAGVDRKDREALTALVKREIYDKVDVEELTKP